MRVSGHIDEASHELIAGWFVDRDDTADKIKLEIYAGDILLGQCVASEYRDDLAKAGIGDGHCAFRFKPPFFLPKHQLASLRINLVDSDLVFFQRDKAAPIGELEPVAASPSRFGSLWIDRTDWIDRLAEKVRTGIISPALSVAIFEFVRDGYYVIPNAVESALISALNDEIELFWRSPPRGLQIETFEPDGQQRYLPPDVRYRDGVTKLLDLYTVSAAAREATASPKVVEFLAAIFEDAPKAFQSLYFHRGSQQAIHKDTAYVKIDSNPLALAATWLALEDVLPGTGELEYYIGSHRAPDYVFGGVSKWMESHTEEHDAFLLSLQEDATKYHQVKSSFSAKAGDVLVWHADLAHGGSPITRTGMTRKSLVTHFTPGHDEPFYRRFSEFNEFEIRGCRFLSQYADVGEKELPARLPPKRKR